MERVLVTGGAGFIGSHVVDKLNALNYTVAVLDDLSTGDKLNLREENDFFEVDVCSTEVVTVFENFKPDVVIHLAAQGSVPQSIHNPIKDCQDNISGTINILENARRINVKKVILSSSAAVYGDPSSLPITETHSLVPSSPYGLSKLTAENYIKLYHHLYGLSYSILRFSNVYGPRQKSHTESGVISKFINTFLNEEASIIFGDGRQTRDFIYVEDVANAVCSSIVIEKVGIYNISSETELSIIDLHRTIGAIIKSEVPLSFQDPNSADIYRSSLKNQLAMEELNWQPKTKIEDGLTKTINFVHKQLCNS